MSLQDKNILITPNIGASEDPKIVFSGANSSVSAQNITLKAYPTSNGTLSFEGSAGQLFSITNTLSGTIYSVNDVSGIPSIEVLDTGLVKLAQYSGNVLVGTGTDDGIGKFQINGTFTSKNTTTGSKLFRLEGNNSKYLYGYSDSGGTGITNSDPYTSGSLVYMAGVSTYVYSGSTWGLLVTSSYATGQTSLRAPLFYDSDNTGYYVDPASTSNLNGLTVAATITGSVSGSAGSVAASGITGQTGMWTSAARPGPYRLYRNDDNSAYNVQTTWSADVSGYWSLRGYLNDTYHAACYVAYAGYAPTIAINYSNDSNSTYQMLWGSGSSVYGTGGIYCNPSSDILYAAAFYDANDTAYYCDPNGTSSFNAAYVYGSWYFKSAAGSGGYSGSVNGARLQAYSDDGGAAMLAFHRSGAYAVNMGLDPDNVLRIGGWSAGANRLQLDMSGNMWTASSMRSNIFYDQDDTNYYCDPNSTSRLSKLNVVSSMNAQFYENENTITASYSITSNRNAMTAGPVTINNGVTITIPNGSVWTVV